MAPAAIAFWRETSIAVILLLLTTANICTCGDDVLEYQADTDVETPTMPEILSQHKSALIENNTIDEKNSTSEKTPNKSNKYSSAKDKNPNEKNEKDHPSYGHVDNNIKKFPPKWKHPQKMFSMETKPAGSSVRFKCAVDGNPTPNITWQKNGGPVVRTYFQPSYGKWAMGLDELTKTDNGNYSCIACNEMGCINHTVTLNVQERYPSMSYIKEGYPGNITVLVNDTVQLSCPPISDLEPTVVWKRSANQTAVPVETIIDVHIFDVVKERLYAKPVATKKAANLTVLVGETAQFSCEFLSDLHPYIYWMFFFKDEKVYGDDSEDEMNDFLRDSSIKTIMSENSTDKPEQLTLYNVTKEKEGWYVCVAINALGSSTAKGYLTVLESLPEKEPFDHGKHTLLIYIQMSAVGAMFLVAAIIVMIFKKSKREKRRRLRNSWQ